MNILYYNYNTYSRADILLFIVKYYKLIINIMNVNKYYID